VIQGKVGLHNIREILIPVGLHNIQMIQGKVGLRKIQLIQGKLPEKARCTGIISFPATTSTGK
jgi:hypothetical protein